MWLLLACAIPPLTCREPSVWVTNAEGREDGYCTVSFTACEGDEALDVTCDNGTFDGAYDCGWMWRRGGALRSDTFESPDFCTLDIAGMVAAINAETPLDVTVQ